MFVALISTMHIWGGVFGIYCHIMGALAQVQILFALMTGYEIYFNSGKVAFLVLNLGYGSYNQMYFSRDVGKLLNGQ